VPPQQLFPSGGLITFITIKGPSFSCGPLFLPRFQEHPYGCNISCRAALKLLQGFPISNSADADGGLFLPVPPQQLFPSGGFITFTSKRALFISGPLFFA
jgi:hypothetical protein